jgi:hypothetical protein
MNTGPLKLVAITFPAVILPVTDKLDNVPTLVMLGCAAVVTVPAVVAEATVPEIFDALIPNNCRPLPTKSVPIMVPDTVSEVNVPNDLMLGCVVVVIVPAMVLALKLDALIAPVVVIAPVDVSAPTLAVPDTDKELSVPTLVRLLCVTLELSVDPVKLAALEFCAEMPVNELPSP